KRKNKVTKIVSHYRYTNKRCTISWSSIVAQQPAKYEETLWFGCSYYLMQDSFFTTSLNYRNLLN
ncbi:hypothetical protein, partial [Enterococcus lactis]|uniref:hypothetical protein n=1 Tax=Enterococcus lactis TaxID=357441 RepID=UPI001C7DFA17